MNLSIEPLSPAHFEGLREALDTVAREKRFLVFTQAPAADECRAFYMSIIENGWCHRVALLDGAVVGWCDVLPTHGQAHAHVGTLGIGLIPSARRRGIGTRLMEAAIEAAWATGLTRIELTVRADNPSAKALYERLGFRVEGFLRGSFRVDGEYFDSHAMALLRTHGSVDRVEDAPTATGFSVRHLSVDDVSLMDALLDVFGDAFDEVDTYGACRPRPAYQRQLLAGESFIALAALEGSQVIGGLAAYELRKFEQERSEIYIYDLAVAQAHRRNGVATELIRALQRLGAERGAYVIFVQADPPDAPAIALYAKLGAREEVLHFDIPVPALRGPSP